jgi:hypothetical protein
MHEGVRLDFCAKHGTFFDRGELRRVLDKAMARLPPAPPALSPSLGDIQTTIRHEAQFAQDPIGTSLIDWLTGGTDWVNSGWRR